MRRQGQIPVEVLLAQEDLLASSGGSAAGAEAALLAGMAGGRAYLNVHTSFAGAGEIRGFLAQVPEPSALPLFALGVLAVGRRRRRRAAPRA